ncbi:alkaline phosphatase family protein [Sesbania bispinosa]|nr:alkaline phosphatase family protein [Sesbania bispinosa]
MEGHSTAAEERKRREKRELAARGRAAAMAAGPATVAGALCARRGRLGSGGATRPCLKWKKTHRGGWMEKTTAVKGEGRGSPARFWGGACGGEPRWKRPRTAA